MANPGKNKLLRYLRVYVNSYDLSGDARTVSSLDNTLSEINMTGLNATVSQFLPDQIRMVGVRGLRCFGNDDTGGAHTILKNPGGSVAATNCAFALGGNAEPEVGDPVYMLISSQMSAGGSFDGGAYVLDADFLGQGIYNANPWGKILMPKTSLSVTTNGTEVDNGAATTSGYIAYLILFAVSSASFTFKVEHATTLPTWSTLANFTLTGSAINNETVQSTTATVNRYTRFVATRTSGSVTAFCGLTRRS